jgi:two-component system LytT family response regulator
MKLQQFLDKFTPERTEKQKIAIPGIEGLTFVDIKEIVRMESIGNYTRIFLLGNKKITTSKSLKEFEEMLPDSVFFRVHTSHLVNLNYIKKYFKGRGGYIVMDDETRIEVAARRKDSFLNRFS